MEHEGLKLRRGIGSTLSLEAPVVANDEKSGGEAGIEDIEQSCGPSAKKARLEDEGLKIRRGTGSTLPLETAVVADDEKSGGEAGIENIEPSCGPGYIEYLLPILVSIVGNVLYVMTCRLPSEQDFRDLAVKVPENNSDKVWLEQYGKCPLALLLRTPDAMWRVFGTYWGGSFFGIPLFLAGLGVLNASKYDHMRGVAMLFFIPFGIGANLLHASWTFNNRFGQKNGIKHTVMNGHGVIMCMLAHLAIFVIMVRWLLRAHSPKSREKLRGNSKSTLVMLRNAVVYGDVRGLQPVSDPSYSIWAVSARYGVAASLGALILINLPRLVCLALSSGHMAEFEKMVMGVKESTDSVTSKYNELLAKYP